MLMLTEVGFPVGDFLRQRLGQVGRFLKSWRISMEIEQRNSGNIS